MLLAAAIVAYLVVFIAARVGLTARLSDTAERWEPALKRSGPWIAALVSIVVVWVTWDALSPLAKIHDESSYLLQADIFARLRWTVPSPPIPEFFEQPHVLVTPAVASKYPPGHALLLTLGALAGFHALVPLLLTGITGALIFSLASRLSNAWTALLTWLIWLTSPMVLRFQPSYMSELTTAPLVLSSWWLLLKWREDRARKWLWWMALAIGWGAITRPLTMLAFAIPIGVVVLRDTARHRSWKELVVAVCIGTAVLAILPLWNARTTGNWRLSPIEQYRLDYLPFDKMGFTPDTTPPRRTISPVLKQTYDYFLLARKQYAASSIPRIAGDRALQVAIALFQESRLPLILFALIGLIVGGPLVRFGALSGLILFAAHIPYSYWAPWTIYYLEIVPLVAFATALGVMFAARKFADARVERGVALAMSLVLVLLGGPLVRKWQLDHRVRARFDRDFQGLLTKLPQRPAIVFVSYSPRVAAHISEVFNYADLEKAPVWVVHSMGDRNNDLRKLAPGRASYDFSEDDLILATQRR